MKYLEKIIKYGLYLLVFILPIQTRWIIKAGSLNGEYFEYGSISLYGVDILLLIVLLFFIIQKILNPKSETLNKFKIQNSKFKINYYWWIVAGLELFVFISIFFSVDTWAAVYGYFKFLFGVGLMWLIFKADYSKAKLILSFILGASVQALIGIWQFFSQSDFASKWLGVALHKVDVSGTSVIETIDGARFLRAYGGMDHPNILGGLLIVAMLFLILLGINSKHETLNTKQIKNSNSKIQNIIFLISYYLLLIILAIGLFVSFSRTAWIGLMVGLAFFLFLAIIKRDLTKQKVILQSILVIGICFFLLFIKYENLVTTRFSNEASLEAKSNSERIESIDISFEIIKSNIFFGAGIGNYAINMNKMFDNFSNYIYQPVHNVYFLVLAEIGIFGFLFFLGFLLFVFNFLFIAFKNDKIIFYKLPLLIAICAMFLLDHWWWSLHFGVFLFWFMSGLILREE